MEGGRGGREGRGVTDEDLADYLDKVWCEGGRGGREGRGSDLAD